MLLLRVRYIAWKRISLEKPSLNKTDSHKTRKKIRICDIRSRNISFTSHLLRWACGRLLCGKTGRFTRRARNRRSNARRFFSRSSPFLFLLYFALFSPTSFFFSKIYTCFLSDDGFQTIIYNRDLNLTEPRSSRKLIYPKYCYYYTIVCIFQSAFSHPHAHPSSAGIRSAFYGNPCQEG